MPVPRINKNIKAYPQFIDTTDVLSLPTNEILNRLGTSTAGLTDDHVKERLEVYGTNKIVSKKKVFIC